MSNGLKIESKDNVATVLTDIEKGAIVTYDDGGSSVSVTAKQAIPAFHKIATEDIAKDGAVIKYGEAIGFAEEDIAAGEHVHVHNVRD